MSNQNGHDNHGHQHDTHYHGEPSRVLDDQALPEAVVFYETGLAALEETPDDDIGDRIETWISQLEDQGLVKRAFLGSERTIHSTADIAVHLVDERTIDPFRKDFEGFPDSLMNEPGLLFIPAGLSLSEGAWSDLKANDVSVNWLSVLPDPKNGEGLLRVAVLSDWITTIGTDVPDVRATGVTPGVFYIKRESLGTFSNIVESFTSLEAGLNQFLDTKGEKIRPGFLRGHEWSFTERV